LNRKQKGRDGSRLVHNDNRIERRIGSQRRLLAVTRQMMGPVGRHPGKFVPVDWWPGRSGLWYQRFYFDAVRGWTIGGFNRARNCCQSMGDLS
jgi:hypothetical protein